MSTRIRNSRQTRWFRRMTAFALLLCAMASLFPAIAMAEQTGVVTASELFLRAGPSTDSEKIRTLKQGWKVTILGSESGWYRAQYDEVVGYCAAEYVNVGGESSSSGGEGSSADSELTGKTVASLGTAPNASKLGDENGHVLKLQEALTILGYYNGRLSGHYGELTEEAVRDYQKAKGLSVDGVAGKGTIKAIFGVAPGGSTGGGGSSSGDGDSAKSSTGTERLDWYNGGKDVIPKDAVIEIKDVRSGRVFKARRWSGGAHIDAEPYTKEDTEKLKKCYGGVFSWARRPVLVKYNGHVYAGSMNGMPHGSDDTIPNNNFDGVFCIHFYKSKTHGSDKVDDEHQACVREAMNASW